MESSEHFVFTWIIENIDHCVQDCISSPTFVVDTIEKTEWNLMVDVSDIKAAIHGNDKTHMFVFLIRKSNSNNPKYIQINFNLEISEVEGSILGLSRIESQLFKKGETNKVYLFLIRGNVLEGQQSRDALKVCCRMWKNVGEFKTDGQCVARTHFTLDHESFLWKIPRFSRYEGGNCRTLIASASNGKTIATLCLLITKSWGNSLQIYIDFSPASRILTFFKIKVSIIVAEGNSFYRKEREYFTNDFRTAIKVPLPFTKDFLMADSEKCLPNDTLTLHCEYFYSLNDSSGKNESISYGNRIEPTKSIPDSPVSPTEVASVQKTEPLIPQPVSDIKIPGLKEDILCMYKENIQSDVKISVETQTLPAHWFILSARSHVFRAMYESGMKERTRDRIEIVDLKPDTVRRMLSYMYTDSLEELECETACDIYTAADKYQILSLKDKCSTFLKTNLSTTNACDILGFADLYQDADLKSVVQDYILKHDADIINSDEWKVLMKKNPLLAAETMFLKFKK